ncbi:IclR family transcriptional regulator [Acinetobacter gerneri]|uniref:IclR family transcriptional regulator n=1 Tax=Acinetobacter gerneri TaxID=202952 RepID=UPI003A87F503
MSDSQVKSAVRSLEIMEYFRTVKQSRSMSEISTVLNYPQSSTTVLLKTLVSLGYLNFNRTERLYFPTLKLYDLGNWIPSSIFSSELVLDVLQDIHDKTGETVSITTKNDIYVQYNKIIHSVHALRFHVNESELRPLTQSSAGWLLMSTMNDKALDNTIRRANRVTQQEGYRVDITEMMERIRQIREQGYSCTGNLPFQGSGTISVLSPINIHGQPVTIGIGGELQRIKHNFEEYLELLRHGVKRLENNNNFHLPIEIAM